MGTGIVWERGWNHGVDRMMLFAAGSGVWRSDCTRYGLYSIKHYGIVHVLEMAEKKSVGSNHFYRIGPRTGRIDKMYVISFLWVLATDLDLMESFFTQRSATGFRQKTIHSTDSDVHDQCLDDQCRIYIFR